MAEEVEKYIAELMAETVEKDLLVKLTAAIEETKKDDGFLSRNLFHLHKDFSKLKDMLEKKDIPLLATDRSKSRETLYHLNNLLTEWQMILQKSGIHAPEALYASHKLAESLKKIRKELRGGESTTSGHTADTADHDDQEDTTEPSFPGNFETYRWSSRYRPETVHGFYDKIRFMERLLVRKESEDGFRAIAIVGVTGVGKTTLCQVMFNKQEVKNHYPLRLWVCLSRQPNDDPDMKKEALKRILVYLGVEEEVIDLVGKDQDEGLRRLIFAVRLQLTGKKYLIVLDDASNEDKFFENLSSQSTQGDFAKQLAYALPKGEGSMVIVTTRSEELAKKMVGEDENVHHLPLLKNKELCWDIFKDTVEKDGYISSLSEPEPQALKDLVVKKCGGLPLSATMMGKLYVQEKKSAQTGQMPRQQTI